MNYGITQEMAERWLKVTEADKNIASPSEILSKYGDYLSEEQKNMLETLDKVKEGLDSSRTGLSEK